MSTIYTCMYEYIFNFFSQAKLKHRLHHGHDRHHLQRGPKEAFKVYKF